MELLLRAMSAHNRAKYQKDQFWNIYETGFIHKQNSHEVVVSKVSRNVWSNCADARLHTNFVVCVYTAKYFSPSLLILLGKRLNRDVLKGSNIEGAHVTI